MKIKILSYNIHKGYDWSKKNYFLQDIKTLIQASQADVVFLQEVVGKNFNYKKNGLVDTQFEFLADKIWSHYSYAQNSIYDHGHHGNLILSKYPIEKWENIDISTNFLEKRGVLICKLRLPCEFQDYLYAACVHLDLFHYGRQLQYESIKKKVLELDSFENVPLIIAGDFNDWNKKSARVFEKELTMLETHKFINSRYAVTYPAAFPVLSLDRIYVKNLKINESFILASPPQIKNKKHFSDHLPLFCELEVPHSAVHAN